MVYTEISKNKQKTALFLTFFLVLIIALGYVFAAYTNEPLLLPIAVGFSIILSLGSYLDRKSVV